MNRRSFLQMNRRDDGTTDKNPILDFKRQPLQTNVGLEPHFGPLTEKEAKHLLRRLGFGAPPAAVEAIVGRSASVMVNELIDGAIAEEPLEPPSWLNIPPPSRGASQAERQAYNRNNRNWYYETQRNWIARMWGTGSLREKLTLFWHNHFVTQQSVYFYATPAFNYLSLLHEHALGNFKTFVREMGTSAAMLIYLDGVSNRVGAPNENYARELLELFTMGILDKNGQPNYTEGDIAQIARAMTGWQVDYFYNFSPVFVPNGFDDGPKEIFGTLKTFDYDQTLDHIFAERTEQIAHFVCSKLYSAFVYAAPHPDIVDQLAQTFIQNDFEIIPVVRQLLQSQHFFIEDATGAQIKSPMTNLIGCMREMGVPPTTQRLLYLWEASFVLEQFLLEPPNVAGWKGHHFWLSTDTMTMRWLLSAPLLYGGDREMQAFDPIPLAEQMSDPSDPNKLARDLADTLLPVTLDDQEYIDFTLILLDGTPDYEWDLYNAGSDVRLRNYLDHLLKRPEFQLN